jgi:hypothetical protein
MQKNNTELAHGAKRSRNNHMVVIGIFIILWDLHAHERLPWARGVCTPRTQLNHSRAFSNARNAAETRLERCNTSEWGKGQRREERGKRKEVIERGSEYVP